MADPRLLTISELRQRTRESGVAARTRAQIDEIARKEAANGKPFWEVRLRDASDALVLRAWSDSPAFQTCEDLERGECAEVEGDFSQSTAFGLEARRWRIRRLTPAETEALFKGTAEETEAAEINQTCVRDLAASIKDPRLRGVCELFLSEHGPRFFRAAAARQNHHAHRGGLLRHTAQMMRSADGIAALYPRLNRDLLLAGTLFHDAGKLWEVCPPETGFDIPRELRGELLGHISIGVELVNTLWKKLPLDEWKDANPANEDVRLHLLHLVASHHGELQYGSPVEPKTPEALALHYIDNLDARLEMIFTAYDRAPLVAPHVHERVRALNVSPVTPLAPCESDGLTENTTS